MVLDPILLSRIQFAFTLSFHILFPTLTIGLSLYLVIWESLWLKTRQLQYYQLCRFWGKLFALAFGIGVVSGLVLSYEFGTNFSRFSAAVGNVVGPLMSYEVLSAFFLEAGFLGVMLFGWNRVSPIVHYIATVLVAFGTCMSAFWILSANSWMQTPTGYVIENGVFYVRSWMDAIFNPSFPYRLFHMVFASILSTTFFIAGVAAWFLLKKRDLELAKPMYSLAMLIAFFVAPLQAVIGDYHGLNTFKYQPLKIAAMEGRWETMQGAPLTLFAIPDSHAEKNHAAIDIPRLGSLILTHSQSGEVPGLKSVPKTERPPVSIVFYSFRVMVGIGLLFILVACIGFLFRLRGKLHDVAWLHQCSFYLAPFGFIAVLAGWFVTEVGRQPWVVYGLMRTVDGASFLKGSEVFTTLILFSVLYAGLLSAFIFYLSRIMRQGIASITLSSVPNRLTAWMEEKT